MVVADYFDLNCLIGKEHKMMCNMNDNNIFHVIINIYIIRICVVIIYVYLCV